MDDSPTAKFKKEILITGLGGQGIILAGQVLGTAACLADHLESTLTQSYGPEARGGACSAQLIISDKPDPLSLRSQSGHPRLHVADGIRKIPPYARRRRNPHYRSGHGEICRGAGGGVFPIPATRIAEELGRKMMANIVMLGFVTSMTGVVSLKGMLSFCFRFRSQGNPRAQYSRLQ